MKEYTLLALFSVIATGCADTLTGIRVLRRGIFYGYLAVILCFKLLVNGYLTGSHIVLYDERFFLNIRFGTIPLEDFLFGFSMVTLTIILWEFYKKIIPSHKSGYPQGMDP